MANRTRQFYPTTMVAVGPTGANSPTGQHFSAAVYSPFTNSSGTSLVQGAQGALFNLATSGTSLISQLFRVQRADYGWSKRLADVNQFGELAAIDRVVLEQPTVNLNVSWLLANFTNEKLCGLTVTPVGNVGISCISGILNNTTDGKNFFLKNVPEGQDADNNSTSSYEVIALGNAFLSSYRAQAAVGGFPSVDTTWEALNMQMDIVTGISANNTGGLGNIPAISLSNGNQVTGWYYILPTGLTSLSGAPLTTPAGISTLRPGDITFNLGVSVGDEFFDPNDIKIQSFDFNVPITRENLLKLGSRFAFAKVIRFPLTATMTVRSVVGGFQTGLLAQMITDNKTFNPSVNIYQPGSNYTNPVCVFQLFGAKLESENVTSSLGPNVEETLTFGAQLGSPNSVNGIYLSGITVY